MTKKDNLDAVNDRADNTAAIAPEQYLMDVLNGTTKPDKTKIEIAKAMLPYRLPRLAQIEATNKNIDYTHEQFMKEFEMGDDE